MAGTRVAFLDLSTSDTKLFCSRSCAALATARLVRTSECPTPKCDGEDLIVKVAVPRGWATCTNCEQTMK